MNTPGERPGAPDPPDPAAAARFADLSPVWGDETLDPATLAVMARALTASGRYRVVERFERRPHYHVSEPGVVTRRALFVDVETTGLDPSTDAIIQFAGVPFTYDARDGRIFTVGECVSQLEDPGRPIPERVTQLTGLADADVRGQRIDDAAIAALVANTDLVLAHNAGFDRQFVERRFPIFAEKAWGCSLSEIPWADEGLGSSKLEWLAFQQAGLFYQAHRADEDCLMAIHLLATTLPSGRSALGVLLARCRTRCIRFWATGAPFESRHILRARGYTFSGGEDGLPRAWWREVPEADASDEVGWLLEHVYTGCAKPGYQHVRVNAWNRYSARVGPTPD